MRSCCVLPERFKTIEKRALACKSIFSRAEGNREPRGAINFRKMRGPAASGWPFNREVVAANVIDVEITFHRIAQDRLAGTLAHIAKRLQFAGTFYAEFFFEFAPSCGFRVLSIALVLPWAVTRRLDRVCAKKARPDGRGGLQSLRRRGGTSECQRC